MHAKAVIPSGGIINHKCVCACHQKSQVVTAGHGTVVHISDLEDVVALEPQELGELRSGGRWGLDHKGPVTAGVTSCSALWGAST